MNAANQVLLNPDILVGAALEAHGGGAGLTAMLVKALVPRKMFSYCFSLRMCSGLAMSLSAPGMSESSSSTTVTREPSS